MSCRIEPKYNEARWLRSLIPPLLLLISLSITGSAFAAGTKAYTNQKYKFTLGYPANFEIKGLGKWAFDLMENGKISLRASVEDVAFKIFIRESKHKRDIFPRFARERSKLTCGADGPDGSSYCGEIESERQYVSVNGLDVFEFFLILTRENYSTNTKHRSTVGPIHVVDISRANHFLALMIFPGYGKLASASTKGVARDIIETIRLLPSPPSASD